MGSVVSFIGAQFFAERASRQNPSAFIKTQEKSKRFGRKTSEVSPFPRQSRLGPFLQVQDHFVCGMYQIQRLPKQLYAPSMLPMKRLLQLAPPLQQRVSQEMMIIIIGIRASFGGSLGQDADIVGT